MPDIFVSYGRSDRPHAERLASAFEARGWSVWWDRKILGGESFADTIEKALDQARCVVVLWSASSVTSKWVRDEASEGSRRDVLVPVLLDEIEIPLGFRQLHTITLVNTAGDYDPDAFDALLAAVDGVLRRPRDAATSARHKIALPSPSGQRSTSPVAFYGTVPRSYLYAAVTVVALLLVVMLWGRFGTAPDGHEQTGVGSPVSTAEPVAAATQVTDPARTAATQLQPSGAEAGASSAVSTGGTSSEEESNEPASAASILVAGKGQDFYAVFDPAGPKQLAYAKTDAPIELFPGEYFVELHGSRRTVRVAAARRTIVRAGTISVAGTGADFFEVYDTGGNTQLAYAKTNGALELLPGTYLVGMHGVTIAATVRAGGDTRLAAGRIVVPGSGSTFYNVFDAKGEKQLAYAKTNVEIELLPGAYVVEINNTRRSARIDAGQRAVVDR